MLFSLLAQNLRKQSMSKDIIVLTPNGRRQAVHCKPDTSILQVLEDVCSKQGFRPTDYDLKHHNHVLDPTITIRFSNLPNKATLEMVETERKREETNVTIGLQLEDGERRTAAFPPNTSLYDLVTSLAPLEFRSLQYPTILYMRQEVAGESALREKTLRQLGLIGGRAILRLLNKAEEAKQANVSSVYRRSVPEKTSTTEQNVKGQAEGNQTTASADNTSVPGPSNIHKNVDQKSFDPIKHIMSVKQSKNKDENKVYSREENSEVVTPMDVDHNIVPAEKSEIKNTPSSMSLGTQENLERRLKIEEEVTFLGAQKAIAFMQPDDTEDELNDLPDDFYELTIEEVRRLYHDLQQNRLELENTPLVTSSKREELEKQASLQKLNIYKNAVVRVQFPDRIILQGVFSPTDTIEDVINFIKCHIQNPERPFHIFTTPLKETLDPKMTLADAKCVPCVHMHFKWVDEDNGQPCLKEEIYSKKTTSDAASILASKYRAPSRRKLDDNSDNQKSTKGVPTTSKSNKIPKWFK